MTRNQIEFWKLQEEKRSNRAQEQLSGSQLSETARTNLAREAETHRANVANEGLSRLKLDEDIRSNLSRENETRRANLERERQGEMQLRETSTDNSRRASETQRHNLAQESSELLRRSIETREVANKEYQSLLNAYEAETNRYRADIDRWYKENQVRLSEKGIDQKQFELDLQELMTDSNIDLNSAKTAAEYARMWNLSIDTVTKIFKSITDLGNAASLLSQLIGG